MESVCFLGVRPCGTVQLLHSLFTLSLGPYDDTPPRLCALVGDDVDSVPHVVSLSPMAFASNDSFLGSAEDDFEAHVTGLTSTLHRHLDSNAHQVASEGDDGARSIASRGLVFVSGAALAIFLELGAEPSIAAVACALTPHFLRSEDPHGELTIHWLQASFTKRDDDKFVGGPIRTRRELVLVESSESRFTSNIIHKRVARTFPPTLPPTSRTSGRETPPSPDHASPTAPIGRSLRPVEIGDGSRGTTGEAEAGSDDSRGSRHGGSGRGAGGGRSSSGGFGGGPPPPPPFPVDIAAIVTAAVNAAAQGITAANAANASAGVGPPQAPLSDLKLLHLRMICGVATNSGIPSIWGEVAAAPNKQSGLAMLVQYLMGDMTSCRRTYLGHSDLLHCSIPLYNFVAGDRFVNPGENPACPAGGMSMWTTLQGNGDVGERMASADADLTALDGRNALADQVARAARVHLQRISGATNLQREIGTKTYILSKLFGGSCPLVEGYTSVVTWIDENFASFERQVSTTASCTSFAYDLSRTEAAYYNACIRASTTALLGDPGGRTPISFAMLLDELTWGRYRGQPLPASLQSLLLPSSTPSTLASPPQSTPDTAGTPPGSDTPNTPGLGRVAGREGDPITNRRPIARLRLLPGENTRDALRRATLPTMNSCTFCKRWHLGMSCWSRCARVASHRHPPNAVIDTVAGALVTERAATAAAAAAAGNGS